MIRTVTTPRFTDLELLPNGSFRCQDNGINTRASFSLFLIREAWHRNVDFEDLADGFGPGAGTNGDWSAIRDSSDKAVNAMLERAMNHLFPKRPR